MPTLLYLLLPGRDETEMIWPSDQNPLLRAQTDAHAATCPACIIAWGCIWDTPIRKATFTPRCEVGLAMAAGLRQGA